MKSYIIIIDNISQGKYEIWGPLPPEKKPYEENGTYQLVCANTIILSFSLYLTKMTNELCIRGICNSARYDFFEYNTFEELLKNHTELFL